jgi:LuxR family transcriptional regulator, maltose regulon positive regulatory protein
MTTAVSDTGAGFSELVLRTSPPRPPRHQLLRRRLGLDNEQFTDRSVIVVQAPPGFGKTTLLGQWRREFLARGAAVAWMSADERDDLQRFLHGLVLAVRTGCARPTFGRMLGEGAGASAGELEGITAWLAEVAQTALDLVLIVDEAERLSAGNFVALTYLLHNVPSNLRVVVGARGGVDAVIADLVDYGQCLAVGPDMLRFTLDETMALVRERFGAKVDADTCARLQEMTEGWPLGLQLALAAIPQGGDPQAAIKALAAGSGKGGEHLLGGLVAKLAPDDVDFLTRIAVVDQFHPDLCRALTGDADAAERLARLTRDTPIFIASDASEWCRLHALARDAFRLRLADLPAERQVDLHARAMAWLADHGMIQEAARHAHAAGQRERAYELAEQCLYDAVVQGHQEAVLDWLELLPEAELERRPRLRLAAAWALALSERHEEAGRLVAHILETPEADAALRYECALIASGGAYYADEPDRCVSLFKPWMEAPPERDPRLLQMHANRLAMVAILQGDPARARRHEQAAPHGAYGKAHGYSARVGDFITGLSYLWEGQVLLGEEVLRPALASADADLGRRHPLACMLASLLAAALYERDQLEEAAALLANRLDILERVGTPETALFGYRTAARIAAAQGVEHRALDLLEALYVIGESRRLPRLCVASLADQVRMHAGRFRSETCRALTQRIDDILARDDLPSGPLWRRSVEWLQAMAHVHAAVAAQDWTGVLEGLARAAPLVSAVKLGRMGIEIMALRAFALDREGQDGRALLLEAMNLAHTYGLARTFVDAHPALADWARRVADEEAGGRDTVHPVPVARVAPPRAERAAAGPRAVPSMVLTPKERAVLELLARNLSNKEIAQAMAVGEETVKWHLKNLFGKLDAGTRKHVVRRAQILGLLEGVD